MRSRTGPLMAFYKGLCTAEELVQDWEEEQQI